MGTDRSTIMDQLFEATLAPGQWPDALGQLAGYLGANGASLVPELAERQVLGFPTSQSVAEFMDTYLKDGWYLDDLRGRRAWPRLRANASVLLEHDISSEEERRTHPYYQDFCGAFRMPWWAVLGFEVDSEQWALALYRDSRSGCFERGDEGPLKSVAPQLRRMVMFASRFRQAMDARTVELFGSAMMICLDQFGLVRDMSPAVAPLIGKPLRIVQRRLSLDDAVQDGLLQAAISAACAAAGPGSQDRQSSVVVRAGDQPPLILDVIALPSVARDVFARVVAVVVVRNGSAAPQVSRRTLTSTYGLTGAECELALLVARGESLVQAGAKLKITIETARTVLKRIFSKVGVSRQSELAALLASLAPRQ